MGSPNSLRILHVSEVHWGGVVVLLRHFAAEQIAQGHEVHVLAHPDMPDLGPGVTIHRWHLDRRRPTTYLKAIRQYHAAVRVVVPDVVHVHSFVAGFLCRFPLTKPPRSAAVVYQPHAWADTVFSNPLISATVRQSERLSARRTDLVVANCEDELRRGEALGVRVPGRALGVAVDLATFRPPTPAERESARKALGLTEERIALILGRLVRQKGQDLLLPVWAAHRPADTTLALVGPGDPGWVEHFAGSQWGRTVFAPGPTDNVLPWLWAADVLVLCSRYETVGLVVAEAMSVGLPVVATRVDGAQEVLLDGVEQPAGAVVESADMDGVIRELTRRLEDPDLHRSEAAAGPLRAKVRFAPNAVAERLVAAYREAIKYADERKGL